MYLVLPLFGLFLAMLLAFWLLGSLLGLLVMLLISGVVGFLADAMVPGGNIHGWLSAIGVGLLGSVLGVLMIGHVGPVLFGVPLVPGLVGSVVLVLGLALVRRV